MKKAEKEIQIRTAAKVKLENLKAEMMTAKSWAAKLHADIMAGMSDKCENERFNEIERFKAAKMEIEADFCQKKAALYAETETACQEAVDDDDPEPEEHQSAHAGFVPNKTVWVNGGQWTCAVVARRIINRLPEIPYNCAISIDIQHYNKGAASLTVKAYNPAGKDEKFVELYLASREEPEQQAADTDKWFEDVKKHFAVDASDDAVNSLDNMFGGNQVDEIPTIRKEADNE